LISSSAIYNENRRTIWAGALGQPVWLLNRSDTAGAGPKLAAATLVFEPARVSTGFVRRLGRASSTAVHAALAGLGQSHQGFADTREESGPFLASVHHELIRVPPF